MFLKIKLSLLISFFIHSINLFAQDLTETTNESVSYFQDGINYEYAPANFKTKFRFRMQNRFTYQTENTENLSAEIAELNVRRLRLRLDGTVKDPRLLYRIQLSFTRGDMDYDRTQYPNILRDAVVGWKLSEQTTLWYGQTKLPGNRQRVISSGAQEFVDRSLVNSTFNIDRDLGAQVHHRTGEEKPLWIKLAVSNGEGRSTDNRNNGLAYTSRIEWLPLGKFSNDGDYFEADLAWETSPKLSIGGVYSLNKKTTRPGGQTGTQFTTTDLSRDLETWFADVMFKYKGFSWSSEYARRWASDPVFTDGSSTVSIFKGEGFNTQMGYVFRNNIQPAIRYTILRADDEILSRENHRNQYAIGLSKYFDSHKVKIQSDLTYDEQTNPSRIVDTKFWSYRLQLEIGI